MAYNAQQASQKANHNLTEPASVATYDTTESSVLY